METTLPSSPNWSFVGRHPLSCVFLGIFLNITLTMSTFPLSHPFSQPLTSPPLEQKKQIPQIQNNRQIFHPMLQLLELGPRNPPILPPLLYPSKTTLLLLPNPPNLLMPPYLFHPPQKPQKQNSQKMQYM